jgi:type IV pilus assembly protein PilC
MAQAATSVTSKSTAQPAVRSAAIKVWTWTGKTKQGEVRSGEIEAGDAESVRQRLRQMGVEPTKVAKKPKELHLSIPGLSGVSTKDLLVFTRQFSVMIDAGLPLVQALEILGTQSDNPAFKKVIMAVKTKVESGSTFADGLAEHPKVFDELFVQLVRAGEVGGILDTILNRLGAYIEKNEKLARRVKGAMAYPAIVVTVGIGVAIVLLAFVIPVFEKMFKDFGGALPAPTQFLVDLSHGLRDNWYIFLAVPIALVIAFKVFTKSNKGHDLWDAFKIKAPLFGPVIRKVAVARFTRTLGTMLSSGVPILDALDVVAKSAGNRTIEKGVRYVRAKISEGKNIAGPLAETGVFPPMVIQMIGVGEATGAMDTMLSKIADFYDDEVDVAVAALTSMIEPLMMVVLGGMVGTFMISMYLPIFSLAGAIK